MMVQSFIVRIYRFDNEQDHLAGTIQIPESGARLSFKGADELWDTLKTLVKQGQKESEND